MVVSTCQHGTITVLQGFLCKCTCHNDRGIKQQSWICVRLDAPIYWLVCWFPFETLRKTACSFDTCAVCFLVDWLEGKPEKENHHFWGPPSFVHTPIASLTNRRVRALRHLPVHFGPASKLLPRAASGCGGLPEARREVSEFGESLSYGYMAAGQNQRYHFGAGAPPVLVYFS